MKYLCLAYYDVQKYETTPPEQIREVVKQCPPHDAGLQNSGHLLMSASLGTARATIRPRRGTISVTDGPFIETNEQVGGFFMIEAKDLEEAIAIASKHPAAHLGEHIGWGIEIRSIGAFKEKF